MDDEVPDLSALPSSDCVWGALEDYFSAHGLVRHQIESFNHFLETTLKSVISENSDVTSVSSCGKTSYHLQFTNVTVHRPTSREVEGFERPLLPHAARLRGLTYASSVCVDVVHDKIDRSGPEPVSVWRRVYHSVVLCRIPIMTGSTACYLSDPTQRTHECLHDRGGIFVINGHDKVLVSQQKLRVNTPFVFSGKGTKYGLICEVRSCHELKLRSTSTLQIMTTCPSGGGLPSIVCRLPFLQCNIPLPTLFRVLGASTRDEAMAYIQIDSPTMEHIIRSIFDADEFSGTSQDDAFEWMGREATKEVTRERRVKYCQHILGNELLPHVGLRLDSLCNQRKLHFLGYMVRRLLRVHLNMDAQDDRDDYANKRIDSAGVLMALLMRQLFRAHLKSISVAQHRLVENGKIETQPFAEQFSDKRITSGYKYCFATGNWNATKSGLTSQNGVAQVVGRMTALSAQSNMRRINTPIAREGKCPKPRQLHPTAYGVVCPSESPEGTGCGLVNNLALMTHVRTGSYSTPIAELILRAMSIKVTPLLVASKKERESSTICFVNGVSVGFVQNADAEALVTELRRRRRSFDLPFDTSVTHVGTSIHVASDPGGLCRPLIIASEAGRLNACIANTPAYQSRFQALLIAQIIEYVDKEEESTLRIAIRPEDLHGPNAASYTHLELDPSLMLGVMASLIPFSNHDQAPRVTYQAAMGKQACGWYATNWPERCEAISHVQMYPQIPFVMTKTEKLLKAESVPSGANVCVCITTLGGWNQEDSLLINEASVQRGLFRSLVHRSVKDEEKNGADAERFDNPSSTKDVAGLRVGKFEKLGPDHIVPCGTTVNLGDCLIGKTISTSEVAEQGEARNVVKRDKSTLQRHDEQATVDMVLHTRTRDGTKAVKVRTRAVRIPQVGDKLCPSSGEHEVLCERGWVPIEDVTTEDFALTLDPVAHTMGYERVLETHAYDCEDEPMYEIDAQQVSLKVTLGHRMWVKKRDRSKFDFAFARDIVGKRVSYKKNCEGGLDPSQIVMPPVPVPNKELVEDWLYFFGFWMGDGCVNASDGSVAIAQKKPETRAQIIEVSKRLGLHFTGEDYDTSRSINLSFCRTKNPELCALLAPLSVGALNKFLPGWALHLSVDHSRALLAGLLASDGHGNKGSRYFAQPSQFCCYYTSSTQLRDDVQALALNCGFAANVTMNRDAGVYTGYVNSESGPVLAAEHPDANGRLIVSNAPNWRIAIVERKCEPTVNHGHVHQQHRQTERIVNYTGSVHCITVRTGIFYVRRKGVGCWTGNSSRHGQKGVLGQLVKEEELPFCPHTGMRPDIIVNPHALPSRMTIGQLVEQLLAILCADEGCIGDGTPFRKNAGPEDIGDELEKRGMNRYGNRMMCNGQTGENLPMLCFFGPTFYQRLKHMVIDKRHARARGPYQILTRQPLEGRAHMGGLRFGEMERDTLIAHGASSILQEFLLLKSDAFRALLCSNCGLLAIPGAQGAHVRNAENRCRACGSTKCVWKTLPYAQKLLCQELMAMHLAPRMRFDEKAEGCDVGVKSCNV